MSFHGPIAHFFLVLNHIPLSGCATLMRVWNGEFAPDKDVTNNRVDLDKGMSHEQAGDFV